MTILHKDCPYCDRKDIEIRGLKNTLNVYFELFGEITDDDFEYTSSIVDMKSRIENLKNKKGILKDNLEDFISKNRKKSELIEDELVSLESQIAELQHRRRLKI
jgi:hypothetical protein